METTIRLKPSELNSQMLDMVKLLVAQTGYKEISISLSDNKPSKRLRKETSEEVRTRISEAIDGINSGTTQLVSFTGEVFEIFSKSLLKK